jgi:cyclopropane fatty-acyl-phospholipid synthase-like methyltransferase
MSDSPHYTPGSESELERLQLQARCLEGLTRRLIRESGIRAGMRVLDLGCGPGDVAFLVAEAVGPSGSVVGVDREERSISRGGARRRRDTVTSRSWSPATIPCRPTRRSMRRSGGLS